MPVHQFEVGDYIEWSNHQWTFRGPILSMGETSLYIRFRSEEVISTPNDFDHTDYANQEWHMPHNEMVLLAAPSALYDAIMAATEVENA